jgi:hypothetical protein
MLDTPSISSPDDILPPSKHDVEYCKELLDVNVHHILVEDCRCSDADFLQGME